MDEINDDPENCPACDDAESLGCASCLRIQTMATENRLLRARLDVERCHAREAFVSRNSAQAQRDVLAAEVVSLGKALDAANFREKALREQLDTGAVSVESATLDRKITFTHEQIGQIVHGLFKVAKYCDVVPDWSDASAVLTKTAESLASEIWRTRNARNRARFDAYSAQTKLENAEKQVVELREQLRKAEQRARFRPFAYDASGIDSREAFDAANDLIRQLRGTVPRPAFSQACALGAVADLRSVVEFARVGRGLTDRAGSLPDRLRRRIDRMVTNTSVSEE